MPGGEDQSAAFAATQVEEDIRRLHIQAAKGALKRVVTAGFVVYAVGVVREFIPSDEAFGANAVITFGGESAEQEPSSVDRSAKSSGAQAAGETLRQSRQPSPGIGIRRGGRDGHSLP